MQLTTIALQACRAGDPAEAFRAAVDALRPMFPLHCAAWVECDPPTARELWPAGLEVSPELCEVAAHARRAEVYPAGTLSPEIAAAHPGADILLLPAGERGRSAGSLVLAAPAGAFGDDPAEWRVLGATLADVAARHRVLREAQDECESLRQRAEETEALDVLGLAANRTLDPEEVLALVARFTRTLLGADYVAVSAGEGGSVRARRAVGLRAPAPEPDEDPLARAIMETARPLYVGDGEALRVDEFPFHAAEGMRAGLGVPLSLFGETFGALVVGYRTPYRLTRRDTRLAVTLARHAAVAISNAQLHRAVESRSRELEEAYERLRELSSVKERFFATMSHELRTPISAVKGYGDLLLDGIAGELSPKARQYVERSRTAALTLLALINDLLDFAKIEAGKMEVHPELCSLREIVEQSLAAVEPQAGARGLALRADLPAGLPLLATDAKRVSQVLTNLLSNAVKFTDAGEVRLSAAWVAQDGASADGAKGWVEVRVRDTGRGIATEDLERVFQEYAQVAGSEGTGLGLPISRKLARLLGGDLTAESAPEVGSTFTLRLPAPIPAPPAAPAAAPSPSAATPAAVPAPVPPVSAGEFQPSA